jgi:hypothetical protein
MAMSVGTIPCSSNAAFKTQVRLPGFSVKLRATYK